jgi:hypothetical protein
MSGDAVQDDRYKAHQIVMLMLVKALEAIPGIRATVPELGPFLVQNTQNERHKATYDSLPPLPSEEEIAKIAAR